MRQPRFSIVMPTRNRAAVLQLAIKSALNQTFDDFEVVVSDNNSIDATAAVGREMADPRIRYVRTPESFSMSDSWEFAIGHARGEFVTVLCDDDALLPSLLARLVAIADDWPGIVCWNHSGYYHESWRLSTERNTAWMPTLSQAPRIQESRQMLRRLFSDQHRLQCVPMLLNAVVPRAALDRIRAKAGRLFFPSNPDVSVAVLLLAMEERYLYVDEPWAIAGIGGESIGASALGERGKAVETFMAEYARDPFEHVPLKGVTIPNSNAATVMNVKRAVPGLLADYQMDWENYLETHYEALMFQRANGAHTVGEEEEFFQYLTLQPADVRERLCRKLGLPSAIVRRLFWWRRSLGPRVAAVGRGLPTWAATPIWMIRAAFDKTMGTIMARKALVGREEAKPDCRLLRGELEGFGDIVECAVRLDAILRSGKHNGETEPRLSVETAPLNNAKYDRGPSGKASL